MIRSSIFGRHASIARHVPANGRLNPLHAVLAARSFTDSRTRHNASVKLRDYQEECVQTVIRSLEEGRRQIGVSLATGAGKTVIFTELIDRVPSPSPNASQTLILVHRRELVEQAARHCSNRYPQKTVEVEMGSLHASGLADITIASVQSIISRDRIDKFDPSRFKLLLVDEAHHIVADGYLRVLDHFGLQAESTNAVPALVGVSATFSRHDGLALGKAIKHIVYHKDYIDMIGAKWLSDVIFTTVNSKADISKVKVASSGDFISSSLSTAVNTEVTNLATLQAWQTRASDRKSTLVFCVDVAHLKGLTRTFRKYGIDARYVTGETRKDQRSETLDAFKRGDFPVLMNCGVFTEGTDIPNIDCVLLARPTRSRNLLVQMIGRGMRLHPSKKDCHVIDMVSSIESGIITTPTLFGLDPSEMLSAADAAQLEGQKGRRDQERLKENVLSDPVQAEALAEHSSTMTLTFRDYDSVSDLIDESSGERYIRAISPNAWVNVGDDKYILTNGATGSYLTLEKTEGQKYHVKVTDRLPEGFTSKSPFARPRSIVTAENFESAVRGADTFASKHFNRIFIVSHGPAARWRESPATDAQVEFLNKTRSEDDQLEVGEVTKGKAGDMITKIKFGARGRLKDMVASKKRLEKAVKKEQDLKQRKENEVVRVGPVPY